MTITEAGRSRIGFQDVLWPRVTCTLDELGRVMTEVCRLENPSDEYPLVCPGGWESVDEREFNPHRSPQDPTPSSLRFRVMVNRTEKVAVVGFRHTLIRLDDFYFDLRAGLEFWNVEKIITFVLQMLQPRPSNTRAQPIWSRLKPWIDALRYEMQNLGSIQQRFRNPFQWIDIANAYIGQKIVPWANRNQYTVIMMGYSLGGFPAQRIALLQNLFCLNFDGLWGGHRRTEHFFDAAHKCISVYRNARSPISWPQHQIGRVYQVPEPDYRTVEYSQGGVFTHLDHSLCYFFDYTRDSPCGFQWRLTASDIAHIYGVSESEGKSIGLLHRIMLILSGKGDADIMGYMHWFNKCSLDHKIKIFKASYIVAGRPDVLRVGEYLWRHLNSYASSDAEKARAVKMALLHVGRELQ